jgi:hypothetical protein
MPGDSGATVVTTVCTFLHTGCGCIGHPAFPTPSIWAEEFGRKILQQLGRNARREREIMFSHDCDGRTDDHIPRIRRFGGGMTVPGEIAGIYSPPGRYQVYGDHARPVLHEKQADLIPTGRESSKRPTWAVVARPQSALIRPKSRCVLGGPGMAADLLPIVAGQ